jgi:glycosyltransferase involved in cell wall biosynthesis
LDDDDLRSEMGEANRERVRTQLSWECTSQELLRAYSTLFGGRSDAVDER